jgi:YfiH family protein
MKPRKLARSISKTARAPRRDEHLPAGWRWLRAGGLLILQAAPLARLAWLAHGYSTRLGGASNFDGARVLNLGRTEWDSPQTVHTNRAAFLAALGAAEMHLLTNRQIHSDAAHVFDAAPASQCRGDALLTRARGLLLGVLTADCVPLLLVDTRRRAVAAVHAGWRGTLRRVSEKTLGRMRAEFGTRPRDVLAALGPAIGRCCYEVGIEVVQKFHAQFAEARAWFDGPFDRLVADDSPNPLQWLNMHPPGHQPPPPTARLDLFAVNRWQLVEAGVPAKNIFVAPFCTACRTDLFFSHRRERGRTGRLLGAIGLRA